MLEVMDLLEIVELISYCSSTDDSWGYIWCPSPLCFCACTSLSMWWWSTLAWRPGPWVFMTKIQTSWQVCCSSYQVSSMQWWLSSWTCYTATQQSFSQTGVSRIGSCSSSKIFKCFKKTWLRHLRLLHRDWCFRSCKLYLPCKYFLFFLLLYV